MPKKNTLTGQCVGIDIYIYDKWKTDRDVGQVALVPYG